MVKVKSILKWAFIGLILLFIYFPIIFLTINSFNASDMIQSGWMGFSWEHYAYFFNFENEPLRVVLQTILLALIVAFLSTVLGTVGAIGIFYSKKRASGMLSAVNRIPVINAEVVTAISFALFVSFFSIDKSTYVPLVLGQMILCTPFVVLSVIPKLRQMDNNLYEAALDLGASPAKALFTVIIPQILPGIIAGFLLSVTLSLDDYVIAAYTKPDSFKTISTHIYGLDKNNVIGPQIKAAYWAFTAIIFFIIVAVVIAANVLSYKNARSKKK
ncbi:MAG: ABC transporter permease [Clostridia bacterium]|nr:ABC transporter permease [Clostridia bacterium]